MPVTPVTFSLKVAVMLAVRENPVALLIGDVVAVGRGPVRKVQEMPANGLPATSLIAVVKVAVYLLSATRSAVGLSVATWVVALYVTAAAINAFVDTRRSVNDVALTPVTASLNVPVMFEVSATTVALSARGTTVTVGAVVSLAALLTVTDRAADVVVLPAASRATAVRLWAPLAAVVVFHETEYGDVVSSAPIWVVPSMNFTPTTPTLSDAVADTVTAVP